MRGLPSVGSVASNPATHPTGPWRAPGCRSLGLWRHLRCAGLTYTGRRHGGDRILHGTNQRGRSAFAGGGPAHQGPVVDAGDVRGRGGRGGEGATLAGREPHPFLLSLTEHLGSLGHLGT